MNKTASKYLALGVILGAVALPVRAAIETNHLDTLFPEAYDTPEIYLRKIAAAANKISTNPVSISSGTLNATIDQSSISNLLVVSSNLAWVASVNRTNTLINQTNLLSALTQASNKVSVASKDVVTYSSANVLTNASVQDYVYAVVTNGFFRTAGGSGLLTTINIVSPTNGTYNVFFSGAPPESATLGAVWNYSPTGNFATNAWGPPITITLSTKKGAYWTGGQGNVNYSAFNGNGTTNGYAVITWGSSTSVSNAPGLTNIWIVLGGIDDSKP